jgi:hypothetical protein
VKLTVPLRTTFDGLIGHPGFPGVGQNYFQPILHILGLWNLRDGV